MTVAQCSAAIAVLSLFALSGCTTAADPAPPPVASSSADPAAQICRREKQAGSHLAVRTCRRPEDVARAEEDARRVGERMGSPLDKGVRRDP